MESFDEDARAACDQLAQGFSDLIMELSQRELLPELRVLALSLADQCQFRQQGEAASLAKALARCCALLYEGQVDPGQALLLLASGTESLQQVIRSAPDSKLLVDSELGLAAARYELETLFPVLGETAKSHKSGPDVQLVRLRHPKPSTD